MDIADLRILFLGNCADPKTSANDPNVVTSKLRYHNEIFQILTELSKTLIGTNDPDDLFKRNGEYDYVFSLFNRIGFRLSEIYPSAVCEYLRVPYLGASPDIRGIAENKGLYKRVAQSCGMDVARSTSFYPGDKIEQPEGLNAPYFIKPQEGGNSEWIRPSSFCLDWAAAKEEIDFLLAKNLPVLMEEFVDGINLTVPVLGGQAPQVLGIIEVPTNETHNVLTSDEKLQDHGDMSFTVFDDPELKKIISRHAALLNEALTPIDYFRIDYRYNPTKKQLVTLEINICCDISSFGSFAFAAAQNGLTQKDLVEKILQISLRRQIIADTND